MRQQHRVYLTISLALAVALLVASDQVLTVSRPQLWSSSTAPNADRLNEQWGTGTTSETRSSGPAFVMPTIGTFTSNFGYRWGTLHGGIDITNSLGTPIVAATDGVVIASGPTNTNGYGAWVKIRHSDGTVTLYAQIDSWKVAVGQRVLAGDLIATIGNRGNSTGPHLHFEVLLGGVQRIDPQDWLAQRGIFFTKFGD